MNSETNNLRLETNPSDLAGPRFREVDLGDVQSFAKLPAKVYLDGGPYYVSRAGEGYNLLSTVCPHQGGEVVDRGACFECPHHGWRFEHADGKCINVPSRQLTSYPVTQREGRLFAELPLGPMTRPGRMPRKRLDGLTIQLHAHACLEIKYRNFSLLTDPWLVGTAFLGSWTHYPPPVVKVEKLNPTAILITHEHSDHFSEATLEHFDRETIVYVPDFPNRRLVERLTILGFKDVRPLSFGETYRIHDDFSITCYEPASLWNDCMVLLEINGFRVLNLNDVGLNSRIAARVAPVDMIAAQFSTGASGYPLTWQHLTAENKAAITESARRGKLQMLKEAMEMYGGSYLLPFASHFTLWHPSHREFVQMMRGNTLGDVVRAFEGTPVKVVDLLAGETWEGGSGQITRTAYNREGLYERSNILKYVADRFDEQEFEKYHGHPGGPTPKEVEHYFLKLNDTAEIAFCEDLIVEVRTTDGKAGAEGLRVSFAVERGRLRILRARLWFPHLLIEIPGNVLNRIIKENLSWDEAFIGYWCRFTRTPDVYHAGFWRMLQAPYFKKPVSKQATTLEDQRPVTPTSAIADVLENYGESAERILRRYGLYCGGCQNSTSDSLAAGGKAHGIDDAQVERMVRELNRSLALAAPPAAAVFNVSR